MFAVEAMRGPLGDRDPDPIRDWFRPFYAAMCAWHEEIFRREIGLPSLIRLGEESREDAAKVLAAFMNKVREGEQDLTRYWKTDPHGQLQSGGRWG